MAAGKDTFGLDLKVLQSIDWHRAAKRVLHDVRSDFIYAPHLTFIYSEAQAALVAKISAELKSGTYSPGLPLTIEVPKSSRMRVRPTHRLGPSFSRPGSILLPKDRLLYQVLADEAAPIVEAHTDHSRSFSHRLAPDDSDAMFISTRTCWSALQDALSSMSTNEKHKYIFKIDVANCFGSINQHMLINVLRDSAYPGHFCTPLEQILVKFTGNRSSRGIIQGLYTSDLLGNYYLAPIDRFFADNNISSARYVDDIYIFADSVETGDYILRELIPLLRTYDLTLNEGKSLAMPKGALVSEEPDLEKLFAAAVDEISEQLEDEDFDVDYGFQSDFDDETDAPGEQSEPQDLNLVATTILFDSIGEYTGQEENIERFCLPLFAQANSEYAVDHVVDSFKKRPAMAQIYASYLVKFIDNIHIKTFLVAMLKDTFLVDWQKMWVLAALLRSEQFDDPVVKVVWDLYKDANRHEALRAVAAIFVGRYGDHTRRVALINSYNAAGSPYVQSAIYYSSRWFKGAEKANAVASWGNLTELNELITAAFQAKKAA